MMNKFFNPFSDLPEMPDDMKDLSDEEREEVAIKSGVVGCVSYILAIIAMVIICLLFGSCKSVEYVFVPQTHTDTLIVTKVQRDSIYINDSTVITEKGDTVTIEKWHTKYVEKQVHDTTYVSKTDTIPQPYPVEKEVPAELTWWQQTRIHLANILLWALLIVGVVWIAKFIIKKYLP